ncbi:Fe2+-dependent dioxygenase [Hyphobacterium sp. HN65]|uniref:Fe2+-dependent dioxygenase n=1 Tax=Hyphobacterium lacteum TaxID=3116575 RepID=A0ABU7LMN2_9PROT|nr:Fe2+-dependent dioxygenase [Hyphobacterium sp. HN65]MEE2525171.1 Fe2+-dependent dioxygenase [Hyphobacterium sp. HN65]
MIQLEKVCSPADISALIGLAGHGEFRDGKTTAGRAARQVKDNTQLAPGAVRETVSKMVQKSLEQHPLFKAYAQPKKFIRTMLSRYTEGMEYGAHTDEPLMSGLRVDLSFTLFLAEPDTYEGGELVLLGASDQTEIKLAAGDAVLYPTQALHRVNPVISGERLAAVGWVRSYIRDPLQRETLFELDIALRSVFEKDGKTPLYDTLSKTRANLFRMWADD